MRLNRANIKYDTVECFSETKPQYTSVHFFNDSELVDFFSILDKLKLKKFIKEKLISDRVKFREIRFSNFEVCICGCSPAFIITDPLENNSKHISSINVYFKS